MNREYIDSLKRMLRERYEMRQRHAAELERDALQYREAASQCDHTMPDGSTAILGSNYCRYCSICDWNDL